MSKFALLVLVAGGAAVFSAITAAPPRMDRCAEAWAPTASAVHQDGQSKEFVESLIRRAQGLDLQTALRPWGRCAADVADGLMGGVQAGYRVAVRSLEEHGVSVSGQSLLNQTVAIVETVRSHTLSLGEGFVTQTSFSVGTPGGVLRPAVDAKPF